MASRISPVAFAILAFSLLPLRTSGVTHRVPAEYPTIMSAVRASASGDTVLVAPGTYTGPENTNIAFSRRGLVLMSEAGPDVTVLDGGGVHRPICLNGEPETAVVRGFTITGGFEGEGGGVALYFTAATIVDCIIEGNYSHAYGGGIYCYGPARIVGCRVTRNSSGIDGGGLYAWNDTPGSRIVDCTFEENTCMEYGGGAYLIGLLELCQCTVAGNQAQYGGGIYFVVGVGEHTLTATHSVITGNVAYGDGGGFSAGNSVSPQLVSCTISGNRAYRYGGAFFAIERSRPELALSILWGDCAGNGDEGYLFDPFSEAVFDCCLVDTSAVAGAGHVVCLGPVIADDPLFQDPESCTSAPTAGGVYNLSEMSPCFPDGSPCGELLGALGASGEPSSIGEASAEPPLIQVFPNPSRDHFSVVTLPHNRGATSIAVYDVTGRSLRRLAIGPGNLSSIISVWDGTDTEGRRVPQGTYLARVAGAGWSVTRPIVLLR